MSTDRYHSIIRKMQPGTIGGQSRVATPVNPPNPVDRIIRTRSCEIFTVNTENYTGATSQSVPYPEGESGDFLYMLVTGDNLLSSTPSGWDLITGITGAGGYERRFYTRVGIPSEARGSENSVDLAWSSPTNVQVIIINVTIGPPAPYPTGLLGAVDANISETGNWSNGVGLFTIDPDHPGHTIAVPWFETSGTVDYRLSASDGSAMLPDTYIDLALSPIPGGGGKQMVVAAINPAGDSEIWENATVPGSDVTTASFTLRVQEVQCR